METIQDLLKIFPLRCIPAPTLLSFDHLEEDELFMGEGKILGMKFQPAFGRRGKGKVQLFNATLIVKDKHSDSDIPIKIFNAYPNINKKFQVNDPVTFLGKVSLFNNSFQIVNPTFNPPSSGKDIIIEYPTVNKISGKQIEKLINTIPHSVFDLLKENLPVESINKYQFPSKKEAILTLHGRSNVENFKALHKRTTHRMIYEEFLLSQIKVITRKGAVKSIPAPKMTFSKINLESFSQLFPYQLTKDQWKTILEVQSDLSKGYPMMRLVQGDVGCGKTSVALVAAKMMTIHQYQVAFMCPTESLAQQHYKNFLETFEEQALSISLLTGNTKTKEKKEILSRLESGEINIIIGTHSLFQETTVFNNLGLAIIDEQHKFGVEQRLSLMAKQNGCHTLIMTATPIPRTLQLAQYGDLEISTIKSIPSNRKKISTRIIKKALYEKYLSFLKTRLEMGEQAYIVAPSIEESETMNIKNVEEIFEQYQKIFPEFNIGVLHGKLDADTKSKALEDFNLNNIQILISTTVIEVGIDVHNATVMSIYNPDRFGLSSLHQLRGRVGRGGKPGFCFLITPNQVSSEILTRLKVIEQFSDGFKISEEDLKIRGEGDLFGNNQSGMTNSYQFASLANHLDIFQQAYQDSIDYFTQSPDWLKSQIEEFKRDLKVSSTI